MSANASSETNAFERARWNDELWAAVWPKRERLTNEVTSYLLDAAALAPGEAVLDIGCGGGNTTLAAARAVAPEGYALGADISEPLRALAAARAAEAGVENAGFVVADMQTTALERAPFDVVLSQFGVMFFDEPVTAFANIHSQLRVGGRLAFACWQPQSENPWFFAPALEGLVPPPADPPPGKNATGPFALADPERTSAILEAAGFSGVEGVPHRLDVEAPGSAVVDDVQFTFMGLDPALLDDAKRRVDAYMERFVVAPGVSRFPLAFQIFTARA